MALDTTAKLIAALWKSLPIPGADEDTNAQLQHITWQYGGVLAGPPFPFARTLRGVHTTLLTAHGRQSAVRGASAGQTTVRYSRGLMDEGA